MTIRFCLVSGILGLSLIAGCSQSPRTSDKDSGSSSKSASTSRPAITDIDFGDDKGEYAKDGECDDTRFTGPGMTNLRRLNSEIGHDSSDCRAAYEQQRITQKSGAGALRNIPDAELKQIAWGDDRGEYSRDGECDDKRFTGPGMTDTELLNSDVGHDASDCRDAFAKGQLSLKN